MIYSKSSSPDTTYTISQFISMKDNDNITYKNFSILQRSSKEPNIMYSIENVIYDYMEEIKQYRKLVAVSDIDKIKYKYKPKLLAYDIYGSTETYFIIMALNGLHNIKDFDLRDNLFWALAPTDMQNLMNTICRAEAEHLTLNRNALGVSES